VRPRRAGRHPRCTTITQLRIVIYYCRIFRWKICTRNNSTSRTIPVERLTLRSLRKINRINIVGTYHASKEPIAIAFVGSKAYKYIIIINLNWPTSVGEIKLPTKRWVIRVRIVRRTRTDGNRVICRGPRTKRAVRCIRRGYVPNVGRGLLN